MKQRILGSVFFLAIVLLSNGCIKKNNDNTVVYFIKSNIGIDSFFATSISIAKSYVNKDPELILTGGNSYRHIGINILSYKNAANSYTIDGVNNQFSYSSAYGQYHGVYGTVIITNVTDNEIQGSFNCTLNDSTKITSGRFCVLNP